MCSLVTYVCVCVSSVSGMLHSIVALSLGVCLMCQHGASTVEREATPTAVLAQGLDRHPLARPMKAAFRLLRAAMGMMREGGSVTMLGYDGCSLHPEFNNMVAKQVATDDLLGDVKELLTRVVRVLGVISLEDGRIRDVGARERERARGTEARTPPGLNVGTS